MKILKGVKKNKTKSRDQKKERVFKNLSSILKDAGFEVRREELKRGHGWKVLSGECVASGQPTVFVDRRMSQDEQIAFLMNKIIVSGIKPQPASLEELPKDLQEHFTAN